MVSKRPYLGDAACTRGVVEMFVFTGVDVSKDKLDVCWLRDVTTSKKKSKKVSNDTKGHQALADWLLLNTQNSAENICVTLEPTGVYHEALMYFLHDKGFKVLLVNPGNAKKYAVAINLVHKTDKSDAFMLSHFGRAQQGVLSFWAPEAPEIRELKVLMRRLDALEKDLQREENRLGASEFSLSSERVLQSLRNMICVIKGEITELTKDIDDHIDQHPVLKKNRELLQSIAGIGPVMSRELVYLFAAKKFINAKQAAAFCGVIPRLNESGKLKGRTTLSKKGPARIRAKLYMATVSAGQHNAFIRQQKERLIKAGKTPMQAIGAGMRKLIQICFGVIKNQTEYRLQVV